jgi:hypothetical protein
MTLLSGLYCALYCAWSCQVPRSHDRHEHVSFPPFKALMFLIPSNEFLPYSRSMEFDHVQSRLVHEFCRIQSIGIIPMELSQNVFSADVFKKCQNKSQDLALPYTHV